MLPILISSVWDRNFLDMCEVNFSLRIGRFAVISRFWIHGPLPFSEGLPVDGCSDGEAVFIGDEDLVFSIRDDGGDE